MLDQIPDELLIDIIRRLQAKRADLVNICKSCKRLRRVAISQLYNNVEITDSRRMHKFLSSILSNPSLALLVRNLHLTWQSSVDYEAVPNRFKSRKSQRNTENNENRSELEEFYRTAVGYGLNPTAFECVTAGSETATAFILLCSLPDLVKLRIKPWYASELSTAFEEHLGTRFLKKLEFFGWRDCITEGGYNLKSFMPFFFLPCIRTIEARLAYGKKGFDEQEVWRYFEQYFGTSTVQRLDLTDCNISGRCLTRLLRIPSGLKEFVYEDSKLKAGRIWVGDPNLNRVVGEALSHISETLEILHLNWDSTNFNDYSKLGPLSNFKVLKKLSINFDVLLGLAPKVAVEMIDILPANLEELLLFEAAGGEWRHQDYVETVHQFLHKMAITDHSVKSLRKVYMPERTLETLGDVGSCVGISIGHMGWCLRDGIEVYEFKSF